MIGKPKREGLGPDVHRRSIFHQSPNFFDFLISDRDAAISPVAGTMRGADEPIAIGQTVDVYVTTCRCSQPPRVLAIVCVGIRNM